MSTLAKDPELPNYRSRNGNGREPANACSPHKCCERLPLLPIYLAGFRPSRFDDFCPPRFDDFYQARSDGVDGPRPLG